MEYKRITTAARELKVSRQVVYTRVATGQLTGYQIDGVIHVIVDKKYQEYKDRLK